MRYILLLLGLLVSANAYADDDIDYENLYDFMVGSYHLIGKEIDGSNTYYGQVTIVKRARHLVVKRTIAGKTVTGRGVMKTIGHDDCLVLTVSFKQDGLDFEATYLWQPDLDNYARITGYIYHPGVTTADPGLEALFIRHR